jgi:hypothetical protein
MERFALSADCSSRDFALIALVVHAILGGLLVTMRSRDKLGAQFGDGAVRTER